MAAAGFGIAQMPEIGNLPVSLDSQSRILPVIEIRRISETGH